MLLDSAVQSETSSPTSALSRARELSTRLRSGFHVFESNRDMYGFAIRPHHLQRYQKYASIYKEEEAERSKRWELFLRAYIEENVAEPSNLNPPEEAPEGGLSNHSLKDLDSSSTSDKEISSNNASDEMENFADAVEHFPRKERKIQTWGELPPSLKVLGQKFAELVKKRRKKEASAVDNGQELALRPESPFGSDTCISEPEPLSLSIDSPEAEANQTLNVGVSDPNGSEITEENQEGTQMSVEVPEGADAGREASYTRNGDSESHDNYVEKIKGCTEYEELRVLVRDGIPMALRGELWQVFVGTHTQRVEGHYNKLLGDCDLTGHSSIEKWTSQIEKDIPRTFPGHPSLDEDGRNALRRLLTAYARDNPNVGYCQAMNFFAALLLLLMPEENAFWTLTGIINDYFEGYFSEKMLEAQVDQLVFEDLVRENYPKLMSHLEALGVQVTWVSGSWFLSIFVNVLPWESVLRVWDVLLFDGTRSMLFLTALALMDMHAPALMAARDAGDAIALLQSMAGATFDSSQLVLTACMGFQTVHESKLQKLRLKHRPHVITSLKQRSIELQLYRTSQKQMRRKISPNLFSLVPPRGIHMAATDAIPLKDTETSQGLDRSENMTGTTGVDSVSSLNVTMPLADVLQTSLPIGVMDDGEENDLHEQIIWLKTELCLALEEKNSAIHRAEELELALMEMVKEDNRRLLTAQLEKLQREVAALNQEVLDKEEQERAMLKVMLRMEQEQKVTEDGRKFAEEDAALHRQAALLFQEKYEKAVQELALMEKRAIMAESILEATLHYQALDSGAQSTPHQNSPTLRGEESKKKSWSFGSSSRSSQLALKSRSDSVSVSPPLHTAGENPGGPNLEEEIGLQGPFEELKIT